MWDLIIEIIFVVVHGLILHNQLIMCLNDLGEEGNEKALWEENSSLFFVAFVKDNGTMSSIQYFENLVLYFVQNQRK